MIITNKQSIYRAIADTYIKRKPEVIALLQKYGFAVDANTPLEEIVWALDNSLRNNADFINEFSVLVAESGFVNAGGNNDENYYNAGGFDTWLSNIFGGGGSSTASNTAGAASSAAGAVASGAVQGGADPISAIANAIGGIFGFFGAKQQNQNIQAQSEADSQSALYNMILGQQGKEGQSMKTATWITVGVLAALTIVAAAVIISKKRKNA
jgi:hypothetical protein